MIIYFFLKHNSLRFSELKNLMPLISKKVLASQLRELEEDAIILRKVYENSPICIKYELSDYGLNLKDIVFSLRDWGDKHTQQMSSSQYTL